MFDFLLILYYYFLLMKVKLQNINTGGLQAIQPSQENFDSATANYKKEATLNPIDQSINNRSAVEGTPSALEKESLPIYSDELKADIDEKIKNNDLAAIDKLLDLYKSKDILASSRSNDPLNKAKGYLLETILTQGSPQMVVSMLDREEYLFRCESSGITVCKILDNKEFKNIIPLLEGKPFMNKASGYLMDALVDRLNLGFTTDTDAIKSLLYYGSIIGKQGSFFLELNNIDRLQKYINITNNNIFLDSEIFNIRGGYDSPTISDKEKTDHREMEALNKAKVLFCKDLIAFLTEITKLDEKGILRKEMDILKNFT